MEGGPGGLVGGGERKNAAVQQCSAAERLSETRDVRTCGRMDESGRTDGLTLHECADAGATACVTRPTKSKRETSHSHIACCQSQRPRVSSAARPRIFSLAISTSPHLLPFSSASPSHENSNRVTLDLPPPSPVPRNPSGALRRKRAEKRNGGATISPIGYFCSLLNKRAGCDSMRFI